MKPSAIVLACLVGLPVLSLSGGWGCLGPKASVKNDSLEQERLGKSVNLWWEGVRWGDAERSTVFLEDPGLQVRFRYWLEDEREGYRVTHVDVMQIVMGPEVDKPADGRERTATAHVRVEGYTLPAQVVSKSNEEQTWYRTPMGWFVDWEPPEDEDDEDEEEADDSEASGDPAE